MCDVRLSLLITYIHTYIMWLDAKLILLSAFAYFRMLCAMIFPPGNSLSVFHIYEQVNIECVIILYNSKN